MKNIGFQFFCIFAVNTHGYLYGLLIGWVAPTIPKLLDPELSPFGYALNEWQISLAINLSLSGVILMMFCGQIANKFGRKNTLLFTSCLTCVSWIIVAFSQNLATLYIGKALKAQAGCMSCATVIIYLTEIASVNIRGFALTLTSFSVNLGILTMFVIGPYFSFKMVALTAAAASVVSFILTSYICESPTFYLLTDNNDKAMETLKNLNRSTEDYKRDTIVLETLIEQKDSMTNATKKFKELFVVKRNRKSFLLVAATFLAQQFCGIPAFIFHMTSIFEDAGSSVAPHIATIIIGTIQLFCFLFTSLLVELLGRRPLMLVSCLVTAGTNFTLGMKFYLSYIESPITDSLRLLPLVCLVIFFIFYAIGLGCVPNALMGELLDPSVKWIGTSILLFIDLTAGAIIMSSFRVLNHYLGAHVIFWTFSGCCVLSFFFVLLYIPEPKGKNISEIREMIK